MLGWGIKGEGGGAVLGTGDPQKVFEQGKSIIVVSASLVAVGSSWMPGFWVGGMGRAPGPPPTLAKTLSLREEGVWGQKGLFWAQSWEPWVPARARVPGLPRGPGHMVPCWLPAGGAASRRDRPSRWSPWASVPASEKAAV